MENNTITWWIYALLSAGFAALTTIFAKIGVENVNSNLATAIRTVVILVVAWGIVFFQGNVVSLLAIPQKTMIFLLLSGVSTGLSWIFYFQALQAGKASLVAPIDKSSLVLVLLFSVIFLGEPLNWKIILGSSLVTMGTLVLIL
ncbi:EamA family transporter [Nostoc sphaeroides]|jgi:bacterial/archaeal transporter family protein|uniref:TC.BAT1, bacterial/archaeal transporter family protein n=1 Tax=Nostoc sphaeroides CCNUC1 TaxID=2653204 RepID=A0A5P8WF42_9NOSO|nr:EamA family transporter [Nostoc sphaeroides]MCC5632718.1 EamA family transporter [Nostoc sphaeroides CHAB 2801]QFS50806.1 TC.BAT1, bacterial/archaeal transporter family protein [Nostoc sphaeroides CCNUC1]